MKLEEAEERFGDLIYEAWRANKNPDFLNEDRFHDFLGSGYHPEEITLSMMMPEEIYKEE